MPLLRAIPSQDSVVDGVGGHYIMGIIILGYYLMVNAHQEFKNKQWYYRWLGVEIHRYSV